MINFSKFGSRQGWTGGGGGGGIYITLYSEIISPLLCTVGGRNQTGCQ